MDFLELVKQRRSVRKYEERPLSREQAEQILQAAVYAPSGGNNQSSLSGHTGSGRYSKN